MSVAEALVLALIGAAALWQVIRLIGASRHTCQGCEKACPTTDLGCASGSDKARPQVITIKR